MISALNTEKEVRMDTVELEGDSYFKISNSDVLRPFFMTMVSDSNHWLFISSNGGISAGRKNAEYALFPYYTDDKITESAELTGSKSIFLIQQNDGFLRWEPFSDRNAGKYTITRNLYKHVYGNKIIFEEINHDLGLAYQYQWNSSDKYGFVRQSKLANLGKEYVTIKLVDGIQNIVPYGVPSYTQNNLSNLVDAYKRNELIKESGIGIFALSAIIVDRAEPSEALKANIAWSTGLTNPAYLLSSRQLEKFRGGEPLQEEVDVKAEKGAYFLHTEITLGPGQGENWMIIANVNQTQSEVIALSEMIKNKDNISQIIMDDIDLGAKNLVEITASSDGLQRTADQYKDARHFSNTLFNIMRGGIFDHNYQIEKWDFSDYLLKANNIVFRQFQAEVDKLPESFSRVRLYKLLAQVEDADFKRLCMEYLPLKFSRRHGDPSRPWNRFSINTRNEIDGSKILDYEGNWRDIFQNWEALAHSYPLFMENMIHKFLNASTFDGYNPYRVTKSGFDWEAIEPDDPWSYIGYWGDHQIIYLLKFLEFMENCSPGRLAELFDKEIFVYANVPYKIKDYQEILLNPKDTIDFDHILDERIREKREELGADGALLEDQNGKIHHVNFIEKTLATLIAKMSNFIPEGGIWMNTQRPEWNDANNALVGNGVSMVTLYYLRRFLVFFEDIIGSTKSDEVLVSEELLGFYEGIKSTLEEYQHVLSDSINDKERKLILDGLGTAASVFRDKIYKDSFSGKKSKLSLSDLHDFLVLNRSYLEHSIKANHRSDDLYHAYNLMTVHDDEVRISYLDEMLEGQVAVLSSGYLSPEEVVKVLDGMKVSALFREDQYSYILYPNKDLPGFLEKNNIPAGSIAKSILLTRMLDDNHQAIINKDILGHYHFNGNFRNANDLANALDILKDTVYGELVEQEKKLVLGIFEEVFNHKAFTGRSGTFFGYEGLGSIYWHMVSKLSLAVQECCLQAIQSGSEEHIIGRLLDHYYEINEGIGIHKSPELYGAFPTDAYSHTPQNKGAQQPGMTGQVKEDILCRYGELGVFVKEGKLTFDPCLLRREEFLTHPGEFKYVNVNREGKQLSMDSDSLAFTYCQVPVIYHLSDSNSAEIRVEGDDNIHMDSLNLDREISAKIFERTGEITSINIKIDVESLK